MVMVIECEDCRSRFRLAKSLFKDSRAIRVRCRKCGGYIIVEYPDTPDGAAESAPSSHRPVSQPKPEPELKLTAEPEPEP